MKLKRTEASIRTCSIIRWPERIMPGTTFYAIFSIVDFMPTLAAIVGGAARSTASPRAMCCSARARRGAANAARRTFSERCNGKDTLQRRARCIAKGMGWKEPDPLGKSKFSLFGPKPQRDGSPFSSDACAIAQGVTRLFYC
jgi:hypothetical protein